MSAKVYDLQVFRLARRARDPFLGASEQAERAAYYRRTGRTLKCCTLCGKSDHNRQTCKNPIPERLERLNEKLRREDERFAERLARAEARVRESEADRG